MIMDGAAVWIISAIIYIFFMYSVYKMEQWREGDGK